MCAGLAADAGLPMDEAWRAITINPARSLGIDSRVGSLSPARTPISSCGPPIPSPPSAARRI